MKCEIKNTYFEACVAEEIRETRYYLLLTLISFRISMCGAHDRYEKDRKLLPHSIIHTGMIHDQSAPSISSTKRIYGLQQFTTGSCDLTGNELRFEQLELVVLQQN
jgi:hypothetical protein